MKHLTENQVLGDRIYSRLESADEDPLAYISCYINGYRRARTSSDLEPRIRPRPWTTSRY